MNVRRCPTWLIVAAVGAALLLPRVASSWALDLADTVLVHGATVRLADVVRQPVPAAPGNVVVAAGGRPGAALEITGRAILRRLVMANLADGVALGGAERCHIVFAGQAIATDTLREHIAALLQRHLPDAEPEAPPSWLELELPALDLFAAGDWEVSWPQPRTLEPGRNLVTIQIVSAGRAQRVAVVAVLHLYARTAVPVATVARGQGADAADLQWRWTDLALAPTGSVTDPRALADMVAARELQAGETLLQRDLSPRPLVVRGETVDLIVQRGGVAAVVRAECRQDGLLDQMVSIRNPLTNRLVVARVAAPGRVILKR